jgi:hypothetical protein
MAKLVWIALAAGAAAAPLGAQTVPDPNPYYGAPPPGAYAPDAPPPPPGVTWRQRAPAMGQRVVVQPQAGTEMAPGVRTRTWVVPATPPPPPPVMPGAMHHPDGTPPGGTWMHGDGRGMHHPGGPPPQGTWTYGRDGRRVNRHVEIFRVGPRYGAPMGPGFVEGGPMGYGYEGAPLPPPPPCGPCGARPPMGYGYGGGYSYGGGGAVVVTETTVTETPVVERRVWYTTVREKVRVRHHAVRHCRCKMVKARPSAGERG